MKDIRPLFSTTVDPSEYDIDKQMRDFVKAANQDKECFYSIDVGKLWGLYLSWKEQETLLKELHAVFEKVSKETTINGWIPCAPDFFKAAVDKIDTILKKDEQS